MLYSYFHALQSKTHKKECKTYQNHLQNLFSTSMRE